MGTIRDTSTAREVARKFELTIRQQAVYHTRIYLSNKFDGISDSDEDILELKRIASREVLLMQPGKLKRKLLWENKASGLADICWYWDYDG